MNELSILAVISPSRTPGYFTFIEVHTDLEQRYLRQKRCLRALCFRRGSLQHQHPFEMSFYKFCPECHNILYPKEDRKGRILLYACRSCDHQEVADSNRVYRNEVHHSAAEYTQVLLGAASDPTLPRTKSVRCAVCGHGEAIYSQGTSREEGMTLFYVCCNPYCGHRWRD